MVPSRRINDDASWDADEQTLVARIRSRDEQEAQLAFSELYRRYADGLARFAYGYLRSVSAVEDILAEVFLSVWARRLVWDPQFGVRAYFYTAVRRRIQNQHRAEQRATEWQALATLELTPGDDTADELFEDETRTKIRQILDALPEESKRIAILRWQDGLSAPEIAAVLGINRAAVDNRLSRLLKRLRTLFLDNQ